MAVMDIVLYPDEPLMRKAEAFDKIGAETVDLARDMIETMLAYEGVGLAAPQVGISKRLIVFRPDENEARCLVNPEISDMRGSEMGEEGCLSIPQIYAPVPRALSIHVKGYDETGRRQEYDAEGFAARVIQHEVDHLNGRVFPDRLDILSREAVLREWTELRMQSAGSKGV